LTPAESRRTGSFRGGCLASDDWPRHTRDMNDLPYPRKLQCPLCNDSPQTCQTESDEDVFVAEHEERHDAVIEPFAETPTPFFRR